MFTKNVPLSVFLFVHFCLLIATDSSNPYINSLICCLEVESLYLILIIRILSTFSKCFPELFVSLASINKATCPKLTRDMSSPSAYLVSNDIYEFCEQIYASSLGELIEIFELFSLIVSKLLGEYLMNSSW